MDRSFYFGECLYFTTCLNIKLPYIQNNLILGVAAAICLQSGINIAILIVFKASEIFMILPVPCPQ